MKNGYQLDPNTPDHKILLEEAQNGIFVVTPKNGILQYANPQFFKIFRYKPANIIGTPIRNFLKKESDAEFFENKNKTSKDANNQFFKIGLVCADKSVLHMHISLTNTYWENEKAVLVMIHHVSEKNDFEKPLRERLKEFTSLYRMNELMNENLTFSNFFLRLVQEVVPESMQYPDKVYCEIIFDQEKYSNQKSKPRPLKHHKQSDISVHGKKRGVLLLGYAEEAFIDFFEKKLVTAVAEKIGYYVERKENKNHLQESLQNQEAIYKILQISLTPLSLPEILQQILDFLFQLPWLQIESKGSIFLTARDSSQILRMKAQIGLDQEVQTMCDNVPFGKCLCGMAAQTQEIVFRDRLNDDHDYHTQSMVPHGHYCVPIFANEKTLGVLNLYLKKDHQSTPQEIKFLKSIAYTLAGVIERKKAEEALQKNEARFRSLTENSKDCIMIFDEQLRYLYVNSVAESMTGIPTQNFIGNKITDMDFPRQLIDLWGSVLEITFRTGEIQKTEFELPNGMVIDWILIPEDYYDDGRVQTVMSSGRDITKRVQTEKKLFELYRHLGVVNRRISILSGFSKRNHLQNQKEVGEFITKTAAQISKATVSLLYKINSDETRCDLLACFGALKSSKKIASLQIAEFETLRTLVYEKIRIQGDIRYGHLKTLSIHPDIKNFLICPVVNREMLLGFLFLGFISENPLTTQELDFYDLFVAQSASFLEKR